MARTYKRSSNGRFAGGGSQVSSRGGGKRPVAAAGAKKTAPKATAAARRGRVNPSGQRSLGSTAKAAGKGAVKFAKKNPGLVTRLTVLGGLAAAGHVANKMDVAKMNAATEAVLNSKLYAQGRAAAVRGIGGKPGANLRASKKNIRGAYKIRST